MSAHVKGPPTPLPGLLNNLTSESIDAYNPAVFKKAPMKTRPQLRPARAIFDLLENCCFQLRWSQKAPGKPKENHAIKSADETAMMELKTGIALARIKTRP